jgi:hypothetical protein
MNMGGNQQTHALDDRFFEGLDMSFQFFVVLSGASCGVIVDTGAGQVEVG